MKCITMYILLIICIIMLFEGCTNSTEVNSRNDDIVFMAEYYGEPYDSLTRYIVFMDTTPIYTTGLVFSHFYDKRNVRRNENDLHDFPLCKIGVFVKNIKTNNMYVYSKNIHGDYNSNGVYISSYTDPERRFKSKEYFKSKFSCDSFSIYCLQQLGVSMKLSAILNDIPKKIKPNVDRVVLDSVFKAFFFSSSVRNDDLGVILLSPTDTQYYFTEYDQLINPENIKNDRNNQFYFSHCSHILRNILKENFFVYKRTSELSNGIGTIITINEQMIHDSISNSNIFFKEYDDELMLYEVRVYSRFDLYANLD
jgi:hypothetical protein